MILACGGDAFSILKGTGLFQKSLSMGYMREKPLRVGEAQYLVTYDPSYVFKDWARMPEIQWDTALAIRLHNTGSVAPVLGDYQYADDFNEIVEEIDRHWNETGKPLPVACDLETVGLDEYNPDAWIVSITLTAKDGVSRCIYFNKGEKPAPAAMPWDIGLWEQINWILTTEQVKTIGANFKYDSRWLYRKWGIDCTNHAFDTLLVGSLLDENRSNNLKLHAKLLTPLGGYDDALLPGDISHIQDVPKDRFLIYAGGDTDATHKVYHTFRAQLLTDKRLTNFYKKIAHPASKVFEKIERVGVVVDQEYTKQLTSELTSEIKRLETEMFALMPNKIKVKYADNLKITRPAILHEYLFTNRGLGLKPVLYTAGGKDGTKEKKPQITEDHLMMFESNPVAKEFVALYLDHQTASKTLSTFVTGFMEHLRSDGRFHASYMLHRGSYGTATKDSGTVTGRTSLKDPALQTLPKHTKWTKKLRRMYTAPPGYVILQLDFSQGELRIVACIANETTMLSAYKAGKDLHTLTAAGVNGMTYDELKALIEAEDEQAIEMRSSAKPGNFGLLYGMQAPGFVTYKRKNYGLITTLEEATEFRDGWFALYKEIEPWHNRSIMIANKYGHIRSPLGRIRHLPLIHSKDYSVRSDAERQAINAPIQSCLSDMMQYAMVLIDQEYGHEDIYPFLMTHDSLALYVPADRATEWAVKIKGIMDNLPLKKEFGWDHQIPFPVDAECSVADADGIMSLASLKKMKL